MKKCNVKKIMADAKKIAKRLRTTSCTQEQLMAEYKCSHSTIMKVILSQITPGEWQQIRKRKLAQGGVKTKFQHGHSPWNKNLKGIHLSPATEFQKGHLPHNAKELGRTTIRRNKRDKRGLYRMIAVPGATPIRHKWIPYAQYLWEKINGPIPPGFFVVHADGNSLNDNIENYKLVNRAGNLELMKKNNPGWKKKAIKNYKKTCRIKRKKRIQAQRKTKKEAQIAEHRQIKLQKHAQLEEEQRKVAEQRMLEVFGPQIVIWECTNCSAEYEQAAAPERCVKCGRFSFEKNIYRRKTG